MKYKILPILICILLTIPVISHAVEVAPRISDREIIEKLAILQSGQQSLRAEMKSSIDSLRAEMKSGMVSQRAEMKSGQQSLRAEMKSGQQSLRAEMKSGQQSLRAEMKSGMELLGKRIDDINIRMTNMQQTMLVLFGAMVTLIVALFAYIVWDRRTMFKPVVDRLDNLECDVIRDLDLCHIDGSLLSRQLQALREYAKHNPQLAEIMRGLSLL